MAPARRILFGLLGVAIAAIIGVFVLTSRRTSDLPSVKDYPDLAPAFADAFHAAWNEAARRPHDPEKLRALAYLYAANRKFDEARHCFDLLARTSAGLSARDHYYLATIAQSRNKLDEAAAELEIVLEKKADYLPALLTLGNIRSKQGDRPGAEKVFAKALEIEPDQPDAVVALAKLRLQKGEEEAALRSLEDLMAAHPRSTSGAALLAPLLERRGEADRATALRQISLQHPEAPAADPWSDALVDLCYDIQRLSLDFEDAFRTGRAEQGKPVLDRLARLDPQNPSVLFFVGVSRAAAKRYDEATLAFSEALSKGGDVERICPQLVGALAAQGKLKEAADVARASLEKVPESGQIAKAYASVALQQNDTPTARRLLETVLKQEPFLKNENMALAKILWESGDRAAAAECLSRVISIAPDDVPSRALLAEYYISNAKAPAAVPLLEEALRRVPANSPERESLLSSLVEAYAGQADAAAQARRYEEAIESLTKLAALQPKNPTVYLTLGDLLAGQGDSVKAREQWKKAYRLAASDDSALKHAIEQRLGR